jgi:rhamnogalacturonyl hydrolase YesR
MEGENSMTKEKAILDYVIRWLDSNIDEQPPEGIQEDSANLKEKILLALKPETTTEEIEGGSI